MKQYKIVALSLLAFGAFVLQGMEKQPDLIRKAIQNRDAAEVQKFLEAGVDPNLTLADGNTLLFWAIYNATNQNHNVEVIRVLLEKGADPNKQSRFGEFPLVQVASQGMEGDPYFPDIAEVLLDHNASIDNQDKNGNTALHWAVSLNRKAIVKLLIERKADVNKQNSKEDTPLHEAVWHDNIFLVRSLLQAGANPNIANKQNKTALDIANREDAEMMHLLNKSSTKFPPATSATNQNFPEIVDAAARGTPESRAEIQRLIEQGANINATTLCGTTALHNAVWVGDADTVKLLVGHGANVNLKDKNGKTPLHEAITAQHANEDIVKLLIKHKANVNAQDSFGYTPLHHAVMRNNENLVTILLNANADATLTGGSFGASLTALNIAEKNNFKKIIPLLAFSRTPKFGAYQLLANLGFARTSPVSSKTPASGPLHVGQPHGTPQPTVPQGQPAQPLVPVVGGAALQAARPQQGATLFNRRNLIIAMLGTLASGGLLYTYLTSQEVPTLDKDALCDQLTQALTDKQYDYAYQLALKNPEALQALKADDVVQRDFAHRIEQAESALINETGEPLSLYQQLTAPSTSSQLKHLANLQQMIG